jgi:hypothetical protein
MKKIKLLPLLLAFPLLASCGVGSKIKSPKFLDAGKEIKFDKFTENLTKVVEKLDVFDAKKQLKSSVLKQEYASYKEDVENRGKTVLSKTVGGELATTEIKYDAENHLMEEVYKYEDNYVGTDVTGKGSSAAKFDGHYTYQTLKDGKKSFVVRVDKDSKEYAKEALIEDDYKKVDFDNGKLKEIINDESFEIDVICMAYSTSSPEDQKNFHFYQNDKLFTVEVNLDHEEDVLDTASVKSGTVKQKITYKLQVNLVNEKLTFKTYNKSSSEYTFSRTCFCKIDGVNHYAAKGDVYTYFSQRKADVSLEYKETKVKEVDLAKYTKIGATW